MRVMRGSVVLVVLALLLALGGPIASAARKPTRHERLAISWAMSTPSRCPAIKISTVAHGWALFSSRGLKSCNRFNFNGYQVLQQRYGQWGRVYANSGTQQLPCRVIKKVPAKVAKDLGICAG